MKIKEIIKDKKFTLRIILFAVALIVAITAFSQGLVGLSKNKEGYQTIDASADEEAILYAHDFTFTYYFSGSSGDIKDLRKEITAAYSGALSRAYKLLDTKNTYEGFVNLATINARPGENIQVSKELYRILKDAYGRTRENAGYNMFAGALYDYVNSILILENPEEFDPLFDPQTAGTIEALAELTSDTSLFNLAFIDDSECMIRFEISDRYRVKAEELEVSERMPLDLNLLKDAYILDIVVNALNEAGYTNGYISTGSGLTYALSGQKDLEYCIYGIKEGNPAIIETIRSENRTVYSMIKAFGFANESMYYTVSDNGKTVYRNPYVSALNGQSNEELLSLYTVNEQSGSAAFPEFAAADTLFCGLKRWCGTQNTGSGENYRQYFVLKEKPDRLSDY